MPIDRASFKRVLGSLAAGVTIVTTLGEDGRPYGLTATAFTSVSLDPPLVLVCVDKRSESHPHFLARRIFAVNLLAAEQQELSNRFAVSGGEKFADLRVTRAVSGAPVLSGCLGYVDCTIVNSIGAGDHTILIGQVEAADIQEGGEPLVYFRSAYRRIG
jgi:flavin reductase (DIM6/NTAB) family NADH-FMN oxidoreductase RutF